MAKKNGDVRNEEKKPEPGTAPEVKKGDIVRLTSYALSNVASSPNRLYAIGHPNAFQVRDVGIDQRTGEPCVILEECCHKLIDHRTGEPLCRGHQSRFFEIVDIKAEIENARPLKEGDRLAGIKTPLGELVGAEYRDDPDNPHFQFRLAGIPLDLDGELAKWARDLLSDRGLFPKGAPKNKASGETS
jgi:hypothetical protein